MAGTMRFLAFTFDVSGAGRFPVDMLRYDRCVPMGQSDITTAFLSTRLDHRIVHLIGYALIGNRQEPTVARWESFGWTVDPDSVKPVRT